MYLCNVTTGGVQPPVGETVILVPNMAKVKPNRTLQIAATGAESITWTSSDEAVATVDANGLVTAHQCGMAAITATAASGASQWCAIFVYLPGDVNESGNLNIADVTALISMVLSGDY